MKPIEGRWYRIVWTPQFREQYSTLSFHPLNTVVAQCLDSTWNFQKFITEDGKKVCYSVEDMDLDISIKDNIIEELPDPTQKEMKEYELLEDYGGKKVGDILTITNKNTTGTSWKYKGSTIRLDLNSAIKEGLLKIKEAPKKLLFKTNEDDWFIDGPKSIDIYPGDIYYVLTNDGGVKTTAACNLPDGPMVGKFSSSSNAFKVQSLLREAKRRELKIGTKGIFNSLPYIIGSGGNRGVLSQSFTDINNDCQIKSFKVYKDSLIAVVYFPNSLDYDFWFKLKDLNNIPKLTFAGMKTEFFKRNLGQGEKLYFSCDNRGLEPFEKAEKLYEALVTIKGTTFDSYQVEINTQTIKIGCQIGKFSELEQIIKHGRTL